MNWFWLKAQERKRSVTVTEPVKVLAPADAEVRAAEDDRRIRDCIEYGRRHYLSTPLKFDDPSPCPKCGDEQTRIKLVERVDAHSAECDLDAAMQRSKRDEFGFRSLFRQHHAVRREYLRGSCARCGFERGLVLPADAEVDQ